MNRTDKTRLPESSFGAFSRTRKSRNFPFPGFRNPGGKSGHGDEANGILTEPVT